VNVLLMH